MSVTKIQLLQTCDVEHMSLEIPHEKVTKLLSCWICCARASSRVPSGDLASQLARSHRYGRDDPDHPSRGRARPVVVEGAVQVDPVPGLPPVGQLQGQHLPVAVGDPQVLQGQGAHRGAGALAVV